MERHSFRSSVDTQKNVDLLQSAVFVFTVQHSASRQQYNQTKVDESEHLIRPMSA